jgi:hypothetical protein
MRHVSSPKSLHPNGTNAFVISEKQAFRFGDDKDFFLVGDEEPLLLGPFIPLITSAPREPRHVFTQRSKTNALASVVDSGKNVATAVAIGQKNKT